jgi:hypothetical protein
MGVWKVSDAEDPREGKSVFTVANTDNGLIVLAIPDGQGHTFITPEMAERIRMHLLAAINAARDEEQPPS